jgi:hypothetical protein
MDIHPSARYLASGERLMDGWILTFFVVAAFAGGFVSGFSGFAMGLVVSGVWLHIITPIQTAALIASCIACALHGLRPGAAGVQADENWSRV